MTRIAGKSQPCVVVDVSQLVTMKSVPPVGEYMQKDDAKCQRDENASVGASVARLVHVRFAISVVHRRRSTGVIHIICRTQTGEAISLEARAKEKLSTWTYSALRVEVNPRHSP